MRYQISEFARLTGVSVRTLHYYDEIGLLQPAEIDESNGYRYYDEASLAQLRKILYYRELEFPLKTISEIIDKEDKHINSDLLMRRRQLLERKKQLETQLDTLDAAISAQASLNGMFDRVLSVYNYSGFSHQIEDKELFFAWGRADYESNIGFTPDSRFCIGYNTLQFTAFCVLKCFDEGMLHPEAAASQYLDECSLGSDITLLGLLNSNCDDAELLFTQYAALEAILEKVHGKPLGDIFNEEIFKPFGMRRTTFGGESDIVGYGEDGTPINSDAAGVVSTSEDMMKWYRVLSDRVHLSEEAYGMLFADNGNGFSCGFYHNDGVVYITSEKDGLAQEIKVDLSRKEFYISVRNKAPLPSGKKRIMYYPIKACDDGYVKFEVWQMQQGSNVKVRSIRIFDENAEEVYFKTAPEGEYIIHAENNGGIRHAAELAEDNSYFCELRLTELLGDEFDSSRTYFAEVTAECDTIDSAQLGMVYRSSGEWLSMYFNVFYHYGTAYQLFMEALNSCS